MGREVRFEGGREGMRREGTGHAAYRGGGGGREARREGDEGDRA